MDFDREISRMSEQVDRTAERAGQQFARMGRISGKAEAPDGAIRVEVNPGGMLTSVKLTPLALRSGAEAVAEQIMHLANRATRRAGDQMYHALAPVLGPSGEKHLRSLGYEPIPEDDEDAPPMPGYGR
ncbi:YbaB/EbfC family nucleoid-associated protein [Amycolatopsis anabasis]|uniref:YbaB/EbfC family nucleoid-associated protein n=1 Tax=Amycolatopsis anabasis TaxID=1840409 RepID=UPI00131DADE2|nr:YbaB/EbfC family nucleoid-associated protein [Amycolatopsis anabasis]